MEKKKWEKFKAEHRRKPKRKPDDDDNLPTGLKSGRGWETARRCMTCRSGGDGLKKDASGLES